MVDSGFRRILRQKTKRKLVAINERGLRIGEDHPRAKLTDHDVSLILALIEDSDTARIAGKRALTDTEIARKFDISKSTVHYYRTGVLRSQIPSRWKRV